MVWKNVKQLGVFKILIERQVFDKKKKVYRIDVSILKMLKELKNENLKYLKDRYVGRIRSLF